ncbi:MAG: CYCXC family (seleno)protein [Candidatus Binataceae bacterium]
MSRKRNLIVVSLGAIIAVGALGYAGITRTRDGGATTATVSGEQCCLHAAGERSASRLTLEPAQFQGQVREAYAIAERDPALLSQLHCYCGCDRTDGHQNLLDCFRDRHGATCSICVAEARDGRVLADQGVSIDQIRDIFRARFAEAK